MAIGNLRALLVFVLMQVCMFLMMAASAKVQGRHLNVESTPACCLYHPDCCQRGTAGRAAAAIP